VKPYLQQITSLTAVGHISCRRSFFGGQREEKLSRVFLPKQFKEILCLFSEYLALVVKSTQLAFMILYWYFPVMGLY
jgi:ABC-type arginine/histidine transport system permease subunit